MMSLLTTPPADAALEIAPDSVSVVVAAPRTRDAALQGYAVQPLAPGAVTASLTARNVLDRDAVLQALRRAFERLGTRPRRVALLVPDVAARVSLVRFERVPARREDLEQLMRWQVRKAAPFPIEDAVLTWVPAARTPEGEQEFLVVLARRDVIREYEDLCDALGMHAGVVDLATFGVVNLLLASPGVPVGDWLVVYMRPEYTSLAILRGDQTLFFRTVAETDTETLPDVVHQTTMYYQDRLSGQGFAQVILSGYGRTPETLDEASRSLEARLSSPVQRLDRARAPILTSKITASPATLAALTPAIGTLLRMRAEAA
jgi:type IV pilus assembly protein PilM